jgi:hypothetical protein
MINRKIVLEVARMRSHEYLALKKSESTYQRETELVKEMKRAMRDLIQKEQHKKSKTVVYPNLRTAHEVMVHWLNLTFWSHVGEKIQDHIRDMISENSAAKNELSEELLKISKEQSRFYEELVEIKKNSSVVRRDQRYAFVWICYLIYANSIVFSALKKNWFSMSSFTPQTIPRMD